LFRVHSHTHDVNSRGPHFTAPVSQATTRGSSWPTRSGCVRLALAAVRRCRGYGATTMMSIVYPLARGDDELAETTRRSSKASSTAATMERGCSHSYATASTRPWRRPVRRQECPLHPRQRCRTRRHQSCASGTLGGANGLPSDVDRTREARGMRHGVSGQEASGGLPLDA
jgi:hypothetical protein